MAYETHWESNGIHRRFWGQTSDTEIMRAVQEGSSDPRANTLRYVIYDFSDCEEVTYSKEGTEILSAFGVLSEQTNPDLKIAIVADKPATGSLAHTYMSATLNSYPTMTFATLGEARGWLAMQST